MEISFKAKTHEELGSELQKKLGELQEEFSANVAKATSAGDFETIQQLSDDIQKSSEAITMAYEKRLEKLNTDSSGSTTNENLPYDQNACDLDLDLTVYDGDRDYFIEFSNDKEIQKAYEVMKERNPESTSKKHLLKSSLKLTPTLAPLIYEIGDRCKKALGLNVEIEFYVYQDNMFNAACYPPDSERLYITLTSGILERFNKDELTFVIGHEIGHALFLHYKFPANYLLDLGRDYLSPLHAMKLFAWKRNAEISADRVGMICCQDFEAAGSAFFKLSSGVTSSSLEFKLHEYIKQFSDLEEVISSSEVDPQDWYSTHPFSPLRIKALELFKDSKTYFQLLGKDEGRITEEDMERDISKMLSLMEPSYINGASEHGKLIQEFIFWGGFMIMISDGESHQEEVKALESIVDPVIYEKCMQEVTINKMDGESIKQRLISMSKDVDTVLSTMQKLNILRDLSVISYSDGSVQQEEVHVLYNLARLLYINEDFIDKILGEIAA